MAETYTIPEDVKARAKTVEKTAVGATTQETPNLFLGRTLKYGSRGKDVEDLQRQLNYINQGKEGYVPLDVDGVYKGKTRDAVRAFQQQAGTANLPKYGVDGKVGAETQKILNTYANARFQPGRDDVADIQPKPDVNEGPALPVSQDDFGKIQQAAAPQKEQPKKTPEQDGIDTMKNLFTTPEQEEKLRRASVARRGILAIGDALRHLGNIYYTSKGAPAQKFNNPVAEEEARYKEAKKERDADNAKVLSYQQMKAKQEEDKRRWEAEFGLKGAELQDKAAQRAAERERWKRQDEETQRYHTGQLGINQQKADQAYELGQQKNEDTANYHAGMVRAANTNAGANYGRYKETQRMNDYNIDKGKGRYATPDGGITFDRPLDKQQIEQLHAEGVKRGKISQKPQDAQKVRSILQQQGKPYDDYHVKEYQTMEALSQNNDLGDYAVQNFRGSKNKPKASSSAAGGGNNFGGTRHGGGSSKTGGGTSSGKGSRFRVSQAK